MKAARILTVAVLAAAALVTLPRFAGAQSFPDPSTGCGIVQPHAVTVATPVQYPSTGVTLGTLAGPGGTLGITSSVWLANLTVNAYERAVLMNDAAARRAVPTRRVRQVAGRR